MSDTSNLPSFLAADLPDAMSADDAAKNRFTETALQKHKQEGIELAVRMRWVALAVIALLLAFLNPTPPMLYYGILLSIFAFIGWLQRRVARVGQSRAELALLAADVSVFVFALTFPNPFQAVSWPTAHVYLFDNFSFLFVILALGTLSYNWRTIMAVGNWTAGAWLIAAGLIWWLGSENSDLRAATDAAFANWPELYEFINPHSVGFDRRVAEAVLLVLVAGILSVSIRRFNRLVLGNAALERERENLSRYFSPNMVDQLSHNDDPLKEIRAHDAAVIFVDIKGFTKYAAERDPQDVINTLREFHGIMESAVFAQGGTLDKYLGDGLMATFGTPLPASDDVRRAYHCVRRMLVLADEWSKDRIARDEEPLEVSIGVHFGPVVVGDIGGNRLEFTVIGNTVNVASRLEALSRPLAARLVVSADVHRKLPEEETQDLEPVSGQTIRGIEGQIQVWTMS